MSLNQLSAQTLEQVRHVLADHTKRCLAFNYNTVEGIIRLPDALNTRAEKDELITLLDSYREKNGGPLSNSASLQMVVSSWVATKIDSLVKGTTDRAMLDYTWEGGNLFVRAMFLFADRALALDVSKGGPNLFIVTNNDGPLVISPLRVG